MQKKITYEISCVVQQHREEKREQVFPLLVACGVPDSEIVEFEDSHSLRLSFFARDHAKALIIKKKIVQQGLTGVQVSVTSLFDLEWKTKWKSDFKPFMVNPDRRVVPAWMCSEVPVLKGKKKDILIDTELVFGTGTHPTTQFIAGYIAQKKKHIASILDIGTGTGILSLLGASYGIPEIWCYDIEKEAVKTTRKNFALNNMRPSVLAAGNFKDVVITRQFDFVAANVITDELIKMRRKIIARVSLGKYLAVSGVSLVNYKRFRASFEDERLRCLRTQKKDGWSALLYKRVQ